MKTRTQYEWDCEELDEFNDIIDHHHCDSRAEAEEIAKLLGRSAIVLVRNVGNDHDGLMDRLWAYVQDDGKLPEFFSDATGCETSIKVPKRFQS